MKAIKIIKILSFRKKALKDFLRFCIMLTGKERIFQMKRRLMAMLLLLVLITGLTGAEADFTFEDDRFRGDFTPKT